MPKGNAVISFDYSATLAPMLVSRPRVPPAPRNRRDSEESSCGLGQERSSWVIAWRHPVGSGQRGATAKAAVLAPIAAPPATNAESTDEQVLRAIQAGDHTALATLYDRHGRSCFAVAYRVLEDGAAAEDAVQDAFLAVWRQAGSFRPERGAVRTWLVAITRNAAIDRRRGRHARPLSDVPLEDVTGRLATDDDEIFDVVEGSLLQERIHQALAALPIEQRHAIELGFFHGLTHPEIAERTGWPLGTVKGRMRLGLRKLRFLLMDIAPATQATLEVEASGS